MRALAVAAAAAATLCPAIAPSARADTCGPSAGIDYVLPVDGSSAVDRAAWVVVRYSLADAPVGDDAPVVTLRDGHDEEVAGTASWDGREVVLVPDEALAPDATFTAVAAREGREPYGFVFSTRDAEAAPAAPILGPSLSVFARYLGGGPEGDDPCGPIGLERYRVHLDLPAATGTSGPENVAYLVFQTRGHRIDEPTEVARAVDETGGDEVGIDLYVAANGVSGRACFRVLAQDVTGPPSGTTDEACVKLEEGPFFSSMCSAAPGRGRTRAAWVLLAAVVVGLARRRSRPVDPTAKGRQARQEHGSDPS